MAKREATVYICSNCGEASNTWSGRCYSCGEWNTLQEKLSETGIKSAIKKGQVISPESVNAALKANTKRYTTGIKEFDDTLGGGVVPGSVSLIAGQPGIGKSTLMLQIAYDLAKSHSVLYISGEESLHQIATRATRLGVNISNLKLANSYSADDIASTIAEAQYDLVIVDSIQTLSCKDVSSAPGSVSQVNNSAQIITAAAKQSNTSVILVGHVTKEGSIAGPKVLEHVVDVVLNLEGDRYGGFKILRPVKNRFGSTQEAGIFEMTEKGLVAVDSPSEALLNERQVTDGSIVLATIEGTRPVLVEIQALVNKTGYGYPKRAASGFDLNRLNLLVAMMEKRTKLNLSDQDIYINVVGGIKINENAADLAVCMAIASATKGMQLKKNVVVFGEVGLSGEIRHVSSIDKRISEANKLGFEGSIGPKIRQAKKPANYSEVTTLRQALNSLLEF